MSEATPLPLAVQRFVAAAGALGLEVSIKLHAVPTRSAADAAAACGCDVGQIVKSLVFRGAISNRPYLLLVSGRNLVDEAGVAHELGEALRRPDAADVRAITGFAIGGIPPLGHAERLLTLIDRDLLAHSAVWAAAGTPNAVFAVNPARLAEVTGARVMEVKPAPPSRSNATPS